MQNSKSVFVSFLGNAYKDSRVTNLYESLSSLSIKTKVVSFDWTDPSFKNVTGDISVFKLTKSGSSISFYFRFAEYLIRELKKETFDIYLAGDVYTLPFLTLYARIKNKKIYYDCRELYPFLAGLRNKKVVQTLIKLIERIFIKRVDLVIATGQMDAQFIQHYYKLTNIIVMRNLPKTRGLSQVIDLRKSLDIPDDSKIIIYQGVILEGRGLELTIKSLPEISKFHLIILGSGPKENDYKLIAEKTGVSDRVHFMGSKPQQELLSYTVQADFGLALIENLSLSYYYALPNKMFEYIAAGIPVISSSLPQMKEIIDNYEVGWTIDLDTQELSEEFKKILESDYDKVKMKEKLNNAIKELNWDNEFNQYKSFFNH